MSHEDLPNQNIDDYNNNQPKGSEHIHTDYTGTGPYIHPRDVNLRALQNAMEYNDQGQPILRVQSYASAGLTDSGDSGGVLWSIALADGDIPGAFYSEKFGYNSNLSTSKETVWDGGGIYQYLTFAETVSIAAIGEDNAVGDGARTVRVYGLDANFLEVNETITVGGAPSTQTFLRVFRAKVITAGSLELNENVLQIRSGNTSTLVAQIGKDDTTVYGGRGQTMMAIFTVPAGQTGYIMQWTAGSGKQNTDATAHLYIKQFYPDSAWNIADIITTSATTYDKRFNTPIRVEEKSEIQLRAFSSVNNTPISSSFHLFLVHNDVNP